VEKFTINDKWRTKTRCELRALVAKLDHVMVTKDMHKKFGVSENSFRYVLTLLREEEGYVVTYLQGLTTVNGETKAIKVLSTPGTNYREVWDHRFRILDQY
jgi:hypothetical protein